MRGVTKTGSEVQGDVLRFLRGSGLAAEAKGAIYRSGLRPADRAAEDIVVAFTAGLTCAVSGGYRFWLQSAIRTVEDAEGGSVRQHFVVVKLGYDFYE